MANAAINISDESTLLCETCGYVLDGLPPAAVCPECGASIESSLPDRRMLTAWERDHFKFLGFVTDTLRIMFRPRAFYRTLITRRPRRFSFGFALLHWTLASLLFGCAAYIHTTGFVYFDIPIFNRMLKSPPASIVMFGAFSFILFALVTPVAARLTSWEGRYRGLRLPLGVVQRGLDFHAADYLPVALATLTTIGGYRWLVEHHRLTTASDATYLYVLCGEVVLFAGYLFQAYWIGMRNMMYANA